MLLGLRCQLRLDIELAGAARWAGAAGSELIDGKRRLLWGAALIANSRFRTLTEIAKKVELFQS